MAITSAGIARDNVISDNSNLRSLIEQALPALNSSSTFNQGDLVCLDATSHCLRAVAADTDGATILGVSPVSVNAGILAGPYQGLATQASQQPQQVQGPISGVVVGLKVNPGDALVFGAPVYLPLNGDTQTVTVTDTVGAGNNVGIYMGPAVASAVTGTYYPIQVGFRLATGQNLQYL